VTPSQITRDSTFDTLQEMVPEIGSEKLRFRGPKSTEMAQAVFVEMHLVAPSLLAPVRVALAPVIVGTKIFCHSHLQQEWTTVNKLLYCQHPHSNHDP
jgi:hypothetical protein